MYRIRKIRGLKNVLYDLYGSNTPYPWRLCDIDTSNKIAKLLFLKGIKLKFDTDGIEIDKETYNLLSNV